MEPPTPQAADPLTDLLRGLLPERWRHDVATTLYAEGFTLSFTDDDGRRHAFDARPIEPDEPALVTGAALAYSYTQLDESLDVSAELDGYRAALNAIAAREAEFLPLLGPGPGAEAASQVGQLSVPIDQSAPDWLVGILRGALPEGWSIEGCAPASGGHLILSCRDPEGRQHVFECGRITPGAATFVTGRELAFSYTAVDPAVDVTQAKVTDTYRSILTALAARESEILPWLSGDADEGHAADYTLRDDPRWQGHSDQVPAEGALSTRVLDLLPADWRVDFAVMLITDGFAVCFSGADGRRHMLEARHLEAGFPALVSGRHFGFSYFKMDPKLDEAAAVPRYREVLQGFLAQEDAIAADLRDTHETET